jgi:hypothetical protein
MFQPVVQPPMVVEPTERPFSLPSTVGGNNADDEHLSEDGRAKWRHGSYDRGDGE